MKASAARIVLAARTAVERASANHFHIIDGMWSRRSIDGGKPGYTRNFTFVISGEVPFQSILPFKDHLIAPLLRGVLKPGDKWTYAQLHGVPTMDDSGVVFGPVDLLNKTPGSCSGRRTNVRLTSLAG